MHDLEESASHPLPLLEGAPQGIYGHSASNEENLISTPIVFDALSDGMLGFSVRSRDILRHGHAFSK